MKLLNWLFERSRSKSVEPVQKPSNEIRLAEWRENGRLCSYADKILKNTTTQMMLQVVETETPANLAFPIGATIEARALHQSKIEGYNLAIANFKALGKPIKPMEVLEETWDSEPVKA